MKKVRPKNVKLEKIADVLVCSPCWAAFNINFIMRGYPLDTDTIIILIHYAFIDTTSWDYWFKPESTERIAQIRENAQTILLEACELPSVEFNEDMINTVMKKVIFSRGAKEFNDKTAVRRIVIGLAKKNSGAVKAAYEQFSTFAKYQV